jgi:hypothetical protein
VTVDIGVSADRREPRVRAVGGALFASGGLGALELSSSARAAMLLAIVWIAVGPVLADVIDAYALAPYERARGIRARDGLTGYWRWSCIPPVLVTRANSAVPASSTRPSATTNRAKPASGTLSRLAR